VQCRTESAENNAGVAPPCGAACGQQYFERRVSRSKILRPRQHYFKLMSP